MPFKEPNALGAAAAVGRRFTYGPVLGAMRRRAMRRRFDREPDWRRPGTELHSGYERPMPQA
jgi:hypothetical protein